jgi:hypothetical protein
MVHVFDRPISSEDKLERKVQRSWAESVGGKLPHVTEDFYAKWDHAEVVSLIEGMEEAFPDRDTLRVDKAIDVIDKAARDGMLIRQLHEMAEAINPELGTSMKNLEQEELLEAFARGEVIEMDEHKYEPPSEKAYEIADGAIYDPETELVHYTAPGGETYASQASDYIIETDRGHESADVIVKRAEKETAGKFASMTQKTAIAKRDPLDDVATGNTKGI